MALGDTINRIRRERGMNLDELSTVSGVPRGTLSKITAGITKNPNIDTVKAIAAALECSLDAFDDSPTKKAAPEKTEDDQKYIDKYMNLDTHGKAVTNCVIDLETERLERDKERQNKIERTLQIFDLADNDEISDSSEVTDNIVHVDFGMSEQRASAGTGAFLDDDCMTTIKVRADAVPLTPCFGVPVAGDSMEPHYYDDDILIVSKEPVNIGEIGIFTLDGMGYVKQLESGFLHSLNPDYEDIPLTEDVICNGKVVGILAPEDVLEWG